MYNYETIKELAKDEGKSVRDLLALSPNNDPFYVGSAGQMEKAKWFANVYKQMGSPRECHIRRVHYWVVSKALKKPDGSVYENTEEDWIYDSNLDYEEQIGKYKEFQSKEE